MLEGSTTGERRRFLARLLGWEDASAVDHARWSIDLAMAHRTPLVLCGDGDLVPVAHGSSRSTLRTRS
jgi:hypothetical protein